MSSGDPLALELQLSAAARADEAWLRSKLKTRFIGLEAIPDEGDGNRFSVELRRLVERRDELGRPIEKLVRKWFLGATPDEALAKARAAVEAGLARKGARRAA